MTEAENPTLEEALEYFAFQHKAGGKIAAIDTNTAMSAVIYEAARHFSEIEKAVKAGEMALVPVEPSNAALKNGLDAYSRVCGDMAHHTPTENFHQYSHIEYAYRAMIQTHGTDPLIDGGINGLRR